MPHSMQTKMNELRALRATLDRGICDPTPQVRKAPKITFLLLAALAAVLLAVCLCRPKGADVYPSDPPPFAADPLFQPLAPRLT